MAALAGFLTTIEAAKKLGVGQSYVFKLIEQGRLKAQRLGGKMLLVDGASVARFERKPRGRPRKKPVQGTKRGERRVRK